MSDVTYLIVKPPTANIFVFACGNHNNGQECTCRYMPTPFDDFISLMVIPYYKGYMDSDEQYEDLKRDGLILHETDDADTAHAILVDALEDTDGVEVITGGRSN